MTASRRKTTFLQLCQRPRGGGFTLCYNWDNFGLQLTGSVANVKVLAADTSLRITADVFQVTRGAGYTKQGRAGPVLVRDQDAYAA